VKSAQIRRLWAAIIADGLPERRSRNNCGQENRHAKQQSGEAPERLVDATGIQPHENTDLHCQAP
jgi:hypothetical protein